MRLGIITVGALVALGGCDLTIDSDDGRVSAHLGVGWETPDHLDQIEVIGGATVEVYVDPWVTRAAASARGGGGTLGGLTLRTSRGRLSVIGDTEPGVVVVVEVPVLERASLVGDGKLDVFDASADTLELSLAGSGALGAAGRVRQVRLAASGDGLVDAGRLRANTGVVDLRGGAVGVVCVSGGLDASVAGDAVLSRRCE
ncbi:MAG: hypothetical protein CVU56_01975 [Deltaproteobacteria bacterium HGW-Deltaproteobacteria-14]|jgi:hypothetical protein|nr:MAG: hypothetical protein CVU56_01975 [Deltaproteobacteria bacterium HGW-Deltaproteobacteria-14]